MGPKYCCQSCGQPMDKHPELFATDKNGDITKEYCTNCMDHGTFIEPNITYDEMFERGMEGIEKHPDLNKLQRIFSKKMYPMHLKSMKRWKS